MCDCRRFITAAVVALVVVLMVRPAAAQELSAVLLVLDASSIAPGRSPGLTEEDVNEAIAEVGVRDGLPYFARNVGTTATLQTGQNNVSGWFTLTSVPESWTPAEGDIDGLRNFLLAGPGLGSPDQDASRVTLLGGAGLASLDASGIASLQGKNVCAVVYQGTLTANASQADLSSPTLGLVAFSVSSLVTSPDSLPDVEVQILDIAQVCQESVVLPTLP